MKKILNILSLVLIFTILMTTMTTISYAQNVNNTLINKGVYIQSNPINNKISDLAKNKFQFILEGVRQDPKTYDIQADQIDNLYLGDGFNVFTIKLGDLQSEEIYYYPVILNGNIKFILTINLNNDGSCSATLGRDFSVELNNLEKNKTSDPYIVFGTSTGQLFAKNSKGLYSLNDKYCTPDPKNNKEELELKTIKNEKNSTVTKNILSKFETLPRNTNEKINSNSVAVSSSISTASPYGNSLGVTLVNQRDSTGTQRNMCWAAAVACITNYRRSTSLTAVSVCNTMLVGYDAGGSLATSTAALNKLGVSATSLNGVPSFSTIMSSIDAQKPIWMGSSSSAGLHATTLYGYITSSQGVSIQLMDSAYECSKQGYSSGSTFTYSFGSTPMTWITSILLN